MAAVGHPGNEGHRPLKRDCGTRVSGGSVPQADRRVARKQQCFLGLALGSLQACHWRQEPKSMCAAGPECGHHGCRGSDAATVGEWTRGSSRDTVMKAIVQLVSLRPRTSYCHRASALSLAHVFLSCSPAALLRPAPGTSYLASAEDMWAFRLFSRDFIFSSRCKHGIQSCALCDLSPRGVRAVCVLHRCPWATFQKYIQ